MGKKRASRKRKSGIKVNWYLVAGAVGAFFLWNKAKADEAVAVAAAIAAGQGAGITADTGI